MSPGAAAIHRALREQGPNSIPTVRTIGRILERRGALDGRRRLRPPPPPRGWYLPDVAAGRAEIDLFDFIQGLTIAHGPEVEVLTGISLHGALPVAWPARPWTADRVVPYLIEHWRAVGRPGFAQFDNDTRFAGPLNTPDVLGRMSHACLALGVVPVFTPTYQPAFQAAVESLNGRWQSKVWHRFRHADVANLIDRSHRYIAAARQRAQVRIGGAPPRAPVPADWQLDWERPPEGLVIFLRRTTDAGTVRLLGRVFDVDPHWPHRLVRCEVHLDAQAIRFFALRRRAPHHQPLLRETPYAYPKRPRRFR